MEVIAKIIFGLLAIAGLITLGLYWPSDDQVDSDPFTPTDLISTLESAGTPGPDYKLSDIVDLQSFTTPVPKILEGEINLDGEHGTWEFTFPMNWSSNPYYDEDWRGLLNQLVMADPFLDEYERTGNIQAFRQAAFFFFDWQRYYQFEKQTTNPAWRTSVAGPRAARLAYILSEREQNPGLLAPTEFLRLMQLADFHLQRVQNVVVTPADGVGAQDTDGIKTLCAVLDELPSCMAIIANQDTP